MQTSLGLGCSQMRQQLQSETHTPGISLKDIKNASEHPSMSDMLAMRA